MSDSPGPKTSLSHPLRIDSVPFGERGARIGMTFCPGKKQRHSKFGSWWDRDMDLDLRAIKEWGADTLVTLIEEHEFDEMAVTGLEEGCRANGLEWVHIPIVDGEAPDERFRAAWHAIGPSIRSKLESGRSIVIHCKGGLGRTGMLAAALLQEAGMDSARAIALVRQARPGAIETSVQEEYLASGAHGGVRSMTVPADEMRVNVSDPAEVKYWCEKFGCTPDQLRDAVATVGDLVADVESYLARPRPRH